MSLKCLLLLVMTSQIEAGYGGNDLFTSMEAMRRLWKEEKFFVKTLENIVQNMKEAIPQMEMYVKTRIVNDFYDFFFFPKVYRKS